MRVQGLGMRYEHDGCSDGPVCFLAGAGAGGKRKESGVHFMMQADLMKRVVEA